MVLEPLLPPKAKHQDMVVHIHRSRNLYNCDKTMHYHRCNSWWYILLVDLMVRPALLLYLDVEERGLVLAHQFLAEWDLDLVEGSPWAEADLVPCPGYGLIYA